MKKGIIFLISGMMLLTGCNTVKYVDGTWTITFDSNGGSVVDSITITNGEVATKPNDPTKENYTFVSWYSDSYLTVPFDWNKQITSDWTLYASWKENKKDDDGNTDGGNTDKDPDTGGGDSGGDTGGGDSDGGNTDGGDTGGGDSSGGNTDGGDTGGDTGGGDSGGDTGGDGSDTETSKKGHGPDNSTLVSWYIVGSGSLFTSEWSVDGGIQLYSNPGNSEDKGCILSITFEVGDIFKVTNGSDIWFGYEKVNTYSSSANKGITNFVGEDDGYGSRNFKCSIEGTYDMYINGSGVFWIQDAAN